MVQWTISSDETPRAWASGRDGNKLGFGHATSLAERRAAGYSPARQAKIIRESETIRPGRRI
jgi:hypothetical protein